MRSDYKQNRIRQVDNKSAFLLHVHPFPSPPKSLAWAGCRRRESWCKAAFANFLNKVLRDPEVMKLSCFCSCFGHLLSGGRWKDGFILTERQNSHEKYYHTKNVSVHFSTSFAHPDCFRKSFFGNLNLNTTLQANGLTQQNTCLICRQLRKANLNAPALNTRQVATKLANLTVLLIYIQ